MSDIGPTQPEGAGEEAQQPEPPTFTDPFEEEWDDDEVLHKHAEFMRLLDDAAGDHLSDIDRMGTMSQPQIDYLATVQDLPDAETDGVDDAADMPPEFASLEGPVSPEERNKMAGGTSGDTSGTTS